MGAQGSAKRRRRRRSSSLIGAWLCNRGRHRWVWWSPAAREAGDVGDMDCTRCGMIRADFEKARQKRDAAKTGEAADPPRVDSSADQPPPGAAWSSARSS